MNKYVVLLLSALFTFLSMGNAFSASNAQSFNVSVSVEGTCSIATRDMNYPNYSVSGSQAVKGEGTLQVNCNSGMDYSISIDLGLNGSGSERQMAAGGAGRLAYRICQDKTCQTLWGEGGPSGNPYQGSGNGNQQDILVYGEILANQSVPAGNYSDTVTCTVSW